MLTTVNVQCQFYPRLVANSPFGFLGRYSATVQFPCLWPLQLLSPSLSVPGNGANAIHRLIQSLSLPSPSSKSLVNERTDRRAFATREPCTRPVMAKLALAVNWQPDLLIHSLRSGDAFPPAQWLLFGHWCRCLSFSLSFFPLQNSHCSWPTSLDLTAFHSVHSSAFSSSFAGRLLVRSLVCSFTLFFAYFILCVRAFISPSFGNHLWSPPSQLPLAASLLFPRYEVIYLCGNGALGG